MPLLATAPEPVTHVNLDAFATVGVAANGVDLSSVGKEA